MKSIFLAVALGTWSYQFTFKTPSIILLLAALVGMIGVAIFPTDLPGESATAKGRIHLAAAMEQFICIAVVILNISDSFQTFGTAVWITLSAIAMVVRVGVVPMVAALAIRQLREKWFGLFERIFLWAGNVYFIVLCGLIIAQP